MATKHRGSSPVTRRSTISICRYRRTSPIAHGIKFEIRLDIFNLLDKVQFTGPQQYGELHKPDRSDDHQPAVRRAGESDAAKRIRDHQRHRDSAHAPARHSHDVLDSGDSGRMPEPQGLLGATPRRDAAQSEVNPGLGHASPDADTRNERQSYGVRARSKPPAVVLALSASLGAIGASSCRQRPRSRHGRRRRSAPACCNYSATPSLSCSRRRVLDAPADQVRRALLDASRGLDALGANRPVAASATRRPGPSRRVAASASFVAPRPSSRPWHSGDTRRRRVGDRSLCSRSSKKSGLNSRADVALGLTFQGSYSQTKPKDPAYGGHASAMGPAPANIPSPEDGAPVPVTFEVGARLPTENVLRRTHQGSHPRIGLRRRRPVRLRRRWAARHLSGDRRGADAGA